MHETGTATGHYNLLNTLRRFLLGYGTWATPVTYTGTGDGTITGIDTYPATVTETWVIKCKTAVANGGVFSVTGSVTGATADATVGTAYDNSLVQFTLNDGPIDFIVNDQFDLVATEGKMTTAGEEWVAERWDTTGSDYELIVRGPGVSGTEEIFIGIKTYQDVTGDYYNWKIAGFTGYVSGNSFETQPGTSGGKGVPLWNQSTPYWLTANGNMFALAAKIETVYQTCGGGRFLAYGTPGQYPYPLFVAGMLADDATTRYSDTVQTMPWRGGSANLQIRFVDGTWKTPSVWPWANTELSTYPLRDTGGDYPMLPVIMYVADNIYGELDGVFHVSGFNQAVENVIQYGGDDHIVIHDAYRTGFHDYFTLRLD